MSRRLVAALCASSLGLLSALVVSPPAYAAPPTAPWTGSAGGSVASVGVTTATLNLANVGLASTASTVGAQLAPQSTSRSANLAAAVVGLPVSVAANQQTAPPDPGNAATGTLLDVNALGISARTLTTRNEANWAGDGQCPPAATPLSDSTTSTAGIGVAVGTQTVLSTGAATTRGAVSLASTGLDGSNRAPRSASTGSIATIGILNRSLTPPVNPRVTVEVIGTASLTAVASGTPGGASLTYDNPLVRVTNTTTLPAPTVTDLSLGTEVTLNLGAAGTVRVRANDVANRAVAADGTSASGSLAVASIAVTLPLGAGTVSADVLPLSASATSPSGGIDCPAPPVIDAPAEGSVTTDTTPVVTGTGQPGANIAVTVVGGATYGPVEVAPDGTWSTTITGALTPGAYTVRADQTDDLGNPIGSDQNAFRVVRGPVIAQPADGSTITDTTPTISGTGESGGSVTVTVGGATYGPVPVTGGTWSTTVTTPLTPGSDYSAIATQTVGSQPAGSDQTRFRIGAAVVIDSPVDGSTISDTTPAISGRGEPGASVTVGVNGADYGPVTVEADGTWTTTVTAALAPGSYTATATQTIGGQPAGTDSTRFTVSTTTPADVTITSPPDGGTVTDDTPVIAGTGQPGASVTVTVDGQAYGPVTVAGDGSWEVTVTDALTRGQGYTARAAQTIGGAPAGAAEADFRVAALPTITTPADGAVITDATPDIVGTGEPGAAIAVTVDGTAYGPVTVAGDGSWTIPVTGALDPGSYTAEAVQTVGGQPAGTVDSDFRVVAGPTITDPADGSIVTDPTPDITGTGQPGASITVTVDGEDYGPVTVDGDGAWTVPVTDALDPGPYTATARQTVGGQPAGTATSDFRVVVTVAITDPDDGAVLTDPTPEISGTGEPGAAVTVTVGGTPYGPATVSAGGAWTVPVTTALAPGSYTAVATQTVGGQPAGTDQIGFQIVAGPAITTPADGSIVTDPTPDITGTGQPGASITVTVDGEDYGPVTVAGDGTWTVPVTGALDPGPYTATARQTVGGEPAGTATSDFRVVAAPLITAPADGSTTNDTTPDIVGTGAPGASISVTVGTTPYGPVTVDADGDWTVPVTTPLTPGTTYTATATQTVGTQPAGSDQTTFTVSPAAPTAVVITAPADGATLTDSTPDISGTGQPGAEVTVTVGGQTYGPVPVAPGGAWTVPVTDPLDPGPYTATATQTVGGQPGGSDSVAFRVAARPTVDSPVSGSTIADTTPDVSGTGEPGARITVELAGTTYGPVTVNGAGDWTFPVTTPLIRGTAVTADATQTVGGQPAGIASSTFRVALGPTITSPANGSTIGDTTPEVSGRGEPGAQITVTIGDDDYTVVVQPDDTWSTPTTEELDPGPHTATATQTVGGSPAGTATSTFRVAGRPTITAPVDGTTIRDVTPDITGTGEPGSRISVAIGGTTYDAVTVASGGTWTVPVTPGLTPGETYTTVATQTIGGQAAGTARTEFSIASDAPVAVAITAPADGALLTDRTPDISGTGQPDATITVRVGGADYTATVDSGGAWRTTVTEPLARGPYTATATQTVAGDPGGQDTTTFRIADAPVITAPDDGDTTPDRTPTITGTGEPGASITVAIGPNRYGPVTVGPDGRWSLTLPDPLDPGVYTAVAAQTIGGQPAGTATIDFRITGAAPDTDDDTDDGSGTGNGGVSDTVRRLAETGGPGLGIAVLGLLLVGGGVGLALRRRRP